MAFKKAKQSDGAKRMFKNIKKDKKKNNPLFNVPDRKGGYNK